MNCNPLIYSSRQAGRRAFTLLEMIGVLAVIAILASVLTPMLLRQVDKAVSDSETVTLQSFATAFQNSVLRNRVIPGANGSSVWTNAIAAELGKATIDVLVNPRNQTRLFLIDTNGFGSSSFLPYIQSSGGTSLPANPRVMIVSSMGASLPAMNSTLATADFNNLWNSPSGTVPATGPWSGWNGKAADVLVQRINLSGFFVHVLLTVNNSSGPGTYSVDTNAPVSAALDTYFLRNTVLNFYSPSSAIDAVQILTSDYFGLVYDQNVWRSSISTPVTATTTTPDLSTLAQAFANAPAPLGASGSTPSRQTVVNDMINYMNAYTAWANDGTGFSTSSTAYNAAVAAYNTLNSDVTSLVNASSP